jgi:hypothetical protein
MERQQPAGTMAVDVAEKMKNAGRLPAIRQKQHSRLPRRMTVFSPMSVFFFPIGVALSVSDKNVGQASRL